MNKTLLIPLMIFLVSIFSVYAVVESSLVAPVGGAWQHAANSNFTYSCGGNTTSPVGYNATFYHNASGTWKANFTKNNLVANAAENFTTEEVYPDATLIHWNVECKNNLTGESVFDTNATFKFDSTAPTVPTINIPTNNSFQGAKKPYVNWTASTEVNFLKYVIDFATDQAFTNIVNQHVITDSSVLESTVPDAIDGDASYFMRVFVQDEAGNKNWEYHNVTYLASAPSISLENFADGHYISDSTPSLTATVTHQFLSECDLYLNSTGVWGLNTSNLLGNGTVTITPTAMVDGVYAYSWNCNNSGGNQSGFTANRSLIVDTTAPEDIKCTGVMGDLTNDSKSLDHTPEFTWNLSTEANFGNYTLRVDNDSDMSSPEIQLNISSRTQGYGVPNLRPYNSKDRSWFWDVNATDLAGNHKDATNCSPMGYQTDVTNHLLLSGWSIVGIVQSGSINASDIALGLGPTWTTISRYNQTKSFINYNNGSATNGGMSFKKGDVVFINVNADTYWENQTWDTDVNYVAEGLFNLSNVSNDLTPMAIQNQSGWTLGYLERLFLENNQGNPDLDSYEYTEFVAPVNESLLVITGVNNSNGRYITHPANYSGNNGTTMDFGEVVWWNLNTTRNISNHGGVGVFTLNLSKRVT